MFNCDWSNRTIYKIPAAVSNLQSAIQSMWSTTVQSVCILTGSFIICIWKLPKSKTLTPNTFQPIIYSLEINYFWCRILLIKEFQWIFLFLTTYVDSLLVEFYSSRRVEIEPWRNQTVKEDRLDMFVQSTRWLSFMFRWRSWAKSSLKANKWTYIISTWIE